MKRPALTENSRGVILVEVSVVIATIVVLLVLVAPTHTRGHVRAHRINCVSNLKQ